MLISPVGLTNYSHPITHLENHSSPLLMPFHLACRSFQERRTPASAAWPGSGTLWMPQRLSSQAAWMASSLNGTS